ncbi:MAG: 16S rRNA (uracil(1498)-N(3))-methyltransferase [Hyphomicrobiaceae bacterium]
MAFRRGLTSRDGGVLQGWLITMLAKHDAGVSKWRRLALAMYGVGGASRRWHVVGGPQLTIAPSREEGLPRREQSSSRIEETMAIRDFRAQRLFIDTALSEGAVISCNTDQSHYLVNVLRLKAGDKLLVFNGRNGVWRAVIRDADKRSCQLCVLVCEAPQMDGPDIDYVFAPLKRARLDYMVQKATEMGVARLRPVFTERTVVDRVNVKRMRSNVIEAAEQCGILRLPEVAEPEKFNVVVGAWPANRTLVFADEAADVASPIAALRTAVDGPVAVLIGPEGGFTPREREMLLANNTTLRISLGPRIMRADTAAVAVLALVNAVMGDWGDWM